jgi:phage/plasmid-like protein (TIGR03299 family)
MAHEIESMFYVGETPWHGLGRTIQQGATIDEALLNSGLNWQVKKLPLFLGNGQQAHDGYAIVRETDASILGVVGKGYTPLQNTEAFDFFRPLVEENLITLETGGSLREGKRVWILARLKGEDSEIVQGDAVRKFLLLSNSHDGTMAVRVGFTPVRVVCANTLAIAHGSNQSQLIRVRHSSSVKQNLADLREIINVANASFEASVEQMKRLATKKISQEDLRKYVKICLGFSLPDSELSTRALNQINEVEGLAYFGRGNSIDGVRGTVWAAYNGVTQYLSHQAGRSADSRYNSLWFGQGAQTGQLALNEALKIAA